MASNSEQLCTTSQLLYPCVQPPRNPCAHLVPLLYQFTSLHRMPPPCTTCAFFCRRSRSFHVTPFKVADPRQSSLASARSHPSHNGRFFIPSAYPPSVQHAYNHSARTTWTIPFLSLSVSLPRLPLPCWLSVSYPFSCLTLQHTYIPSPASRT
jgi:hypothetical protein